MSSQLDRVLVLTLGADAPAYASSADLAGAWQGESFSIDLDREDEPLPTVREFVLDALADDFPAPVRIRF
jgi:hypothetical protein